MRIYKVIFEDYSDEYFFSATSLEDAKIQAEKWARIQNEKKDEEYKKFLSISFELETEN